MNDALKLLFQSRKFLVGTLAIMGSIGVCLVGILRNVPETTIISLVGAMTGVAWKLIDTIASEDISRRAFGDGEPDVVLHEPRTQRSEDIH